jgi:hypothetical protein
VPIAEYPVPSTLGESSEDDAEDIEVSDSAQEYHNQTYTFRGTAAGLKGILTGEMVPPHGGSKIPISGEVSFHLPPKLPRIAVPVGSRVGLARSTHHSRTAEACHAES